MFALVPVQSPEHGLFLGALTLFFLFGWDLKHGTLRCMRYAKDLHEFQTRGPRRHRVLDYAQGILVLGGVTSPRFRTFFERLGGCGAQPLDPSLADEAAWNAQVF